MVNNMENYLKTLITQRKAGINAGIPSFCCANHFVIESILDNAKEEDDYIIIEATSNQVNQNGGYTKMQPIDFYNYVYEIANKIGFDNKKIILGGDHLGPLPWCELPAEEAMANAEILVSLFVEAGYTKIHLDTSMRLGDDDPNQMLDNETIAQRGARLYKACEQAYARRIQKYPESVHPVYVIGSEVPIPGGGISLEKMVITSPEDFNKTIYAYKKVFKEQKLDDAWDNIIAVVVQPGVEFGNEGIHRYNRNDAKSLCHALRKYPDLVFEGHSTDYQLPESLREMVEDGIAILKVGPALTFALREALFQLAMMEKELINNDEQSRFIECLEDEMTKNPKYWQKYYGGSELEMHLGRKYGFSDRSRYYMTLPVVDASIRKLLSNLENVNIPLGMLKQYMPLQYVQVRDGIINLTPRDLIKSAVGKIVDDYNYAVRRTYIR